VRVRRGTGRAGSSVEYSHGRRCRVTDDDDPGRVGADAADTVVVDRPAIDLDVDDERVRP
jgi:hypothetical protein